MRSRSPRTSAARSDWRGFDGQVAGALNSKPATTKGQGASLILTQYGEVAGTLRARGDSSPNVDGGQNVVCMQDGQAKGGIAEGVCTTLNASHEQPIVCAADDNGKTAINDDLCGSLKVGGGSP